MSILPPIPKPDKIGDTAHFSEKELTVLANIETSGLKPISPTLAAQMYELFLEGYSCSKIASLNPPFREGDILYIRKKYKWDEARDSYAAELVDQIRHKVAKQKVESIEFLTNNISVIHKENKAQTLKYLQTGKSEDLPDMSDIKLYKELIAILASVTGEDKIQKHKIEGTLTQNTSLNINGANGQDLLKQILEPQNAAKVLRHLANERDEGKT